jgi:hypothetical protein
MVAKIVDTATPDAASSTWGDTRGRVRSGSGDSYNGSPKVCRTSSSTSRSSGSSTSRGCPDPRRWW